MYIVRKHSDEKINKLKKLRSAGFSIEQIMFELSLPKTTVWNHVQKIKLSEKQKAILRSNQGGSKKRKIENLKISDQVAITLLKGKDRESVIIASMLYWAEGHKNNRCEFTNTDGKMISLYLKILRENLKIEENRIGITVRIFTKMREKECVEYWSRVTKVPAQRIKVRLNDGGVSGKTQHGICRVTVLKGHATLKLMHSLVKKLLEEYIGI